MGIEMLRAGDIGFGPIGGAAGLLVWAGQKIVDATTPEESRFKHALVVTDGLRPGSPPPAGEMDRVRIVQAMPSGAEEIEVGAEHWTPEYLYIRPHYKVDRDGYEDVSARVAAAAHAYVGTPYSFLDYAAIAGVHLGIKNGLIRRYVTTSRHMICSQLCDQAMTEAGWHVFTDGRLPQDVTPAALYRQMMKMPGQYIVGGTNVWRPTAG